MAPVSLPKPAKYSTARRTGRCRPTPGPAMEAPDPDLLPHLAYPLYWVWVIAGWGDFRCHRLTRLPTTSGLAESRLHLLQLALLGVAIILVLSLDLTAGLALILLVLVVAHAVAGYLDTRIAFTAGRTILPVEQHLHSVLDIAPWLGWGAVAWRVGTFSTADWALIPRDYALPWSTWAMVLIPALVLCVWPALTEFAAAGRAAQGRHDA